MRILVLGGAACGKSAYAEQLTLHLGGPLTYLATMQPFGEDAAARIARHQALRAGKGFRTRECYQDLAAVQLVEGDTVLLECLGNLTANVLFEPLSDPQIAAAKLATGLLALEAQARHLVVVSNDIFADGQAYAAETAAYIALLGQLNRQLAARYEAVVELVCGLPLWHKGGAPCLS